MDSETARIINLACGRGGFSFAAVRPLRAILMYLGFVFLGGALLAPWLYHGAQWAAAQLPALQALAANPFHRFVNRSWLLLAAAGLWPFLRGIGVTSWNSAGLGRTNGAGRQLGGGFALGLASLAVVALLALAGGARRFNGDHTAMEFLKHLTNAGLAAVLVGVLEELFFRGALFGALRKACRWPAALVASSAIYALLHFFQRPESPDTVHWASGLALVPRMMRGFGDLEMLVPGFFNLALAGVLLGLAYQRSGQLYFSIGLHAGWIFWLKSYGFLTSEANTAARWFWGTGKLIDGWLALLVLLPVAAAILRISFRETKSPTA